MIQTRAGTHTQPTDHESGPRLSEGEGCASNPPALDAESSALRTPRFPRVVKSVSRGVGLGWREITPVTFLESDDSRLKTLLTHQPQFAKQW